MLDLKLHVAIRDFNPRKLAAVLPAARARSGIEYNVFNQQLVTKSNIRPWPSAYLRALALRKQPAELVYYIHDGSFQSSDVAVAER